MKYRYQGFEFLSVLESTLPEISDTSLGHISLADFWETMEQGKIPPMAQKLFDR